MGIILLISFGLLVLLVVAVYLVGFKLGSDVSQEERILQIRHDAHEAERRLSDLTRQAFVAMTEHVEQRQRDR